MYMSFQTHLGIRIEIVSATVQYATIKNKETICFPWNYLLIKTKVLCIFNFKLILTSGRWWWRWYSILLYW